MKIPFSKYHGTGNDFIMIDNRKLFFPAKDQELIAYLCDRRFGVGADGLILIQYHSGYDFEMKYYNSDGKLASMCGNGGRCAVLFAWSLDLISSHTCFLAADGKHQAYINKDIVSLNMNKVKEIKKINETYLLDTGSPQLIIFVENVEKINVPEEGKKYRYDKNISEDGINVNFVQILEKKNIWVRTYERGVENETYSCGTGAVAAAIATCLKTEKKNGDHVFSLQVAGGALQVSFDRVKDNQFDKVILTGAAKFVYSGIIEADLNN